MAILNDNSTDNIFLDVNNPGLDGFEVLVYIKREPNLMKIPVIIVKSNYQPETTKHAIQGGTQVIIIKSKTPDLLDTYLRLDI